MITSIAIHVGSYSKISCFEGLIAVKIRRRLRINISHHLGQFPDLMICQLGLCKDSLEEVLNSARFSEEWDFLGLFADFDFTGTLVSAVSRFSDSEVVLSVTASLLVVFVVVLIFSISGAVVASGIEGEFRMDCITPLMAMISVSYS